MGFGSTSGLSYDFVLPGRRREVVFLGAGCAGGTFPRAVEERLAKLLAQRLLH